MQSQLTGKDPDAGKDWRQKEKGVAEDELVRWHHWLNGHESEQILGDRGGQRNLACCSPRGCEETRGWTTTFALGCLSEENSTVVEKASQGIKPWHVKTLERDFRKEEEPREESGVLWEGREKGDGWWGLRRKHQKAGKSVTNSQLTVLHQSLLRPITMKIQDRKNQAWERINCSCVFRQRVTAQHLKAMRYLYVLIWIHLENMMLSEKSNLQTDTQGAITFMYIIKPSKAML